MLPFARAAMTRSSASAASGATSSMANGMSNGGKRAATVVSTSSQIAETGSKRRRYVPPALASMSDGGEEGDSNPLLAISIPSRYGLRRRDTTVGASATPSTSSQSSSLPLKAEEGEEEDTKASLARSPSKKAIKPAAKDPFAVSPRKMAVKPIKIELDASEARAAPKRWKEQYEVLSKQRKRILAPVDTMGCQENGKDEKRKDGRLPGETEEDKARRERFTILVSLMLSSQTKDPVTAEAVHNLQRNLPGGLSLQSILLASQDDISSNINKVGFWRRKTGYIQSAAQIIREEFDGDIPKTIDELCSLPGVGPKMGFLALQGAWGLNIGIGVDVHVHRVANRLKWVNSNDPEGTRLQLQSWLPKEMHPTINKTLVGFGQVVCQPVGPRCDLCALGAARLCPSYRKVDPKSVASRVKVEFLPDLDAKLDLKDEEKAAAIKMEGADGQGAMLIKTEEIDAHLASNGRSARVKLEANPIEW